MLCFLLCFLFGLLIGPIVISLTRKLKFGQNILEYVDEHKSKQGTPTMGGIIFILPVLVFSLFFAKSSLNLSILILTIFLGYGIIGFLDDFIKIKFKRNMGLRAYQKIIFQLSIAIIVAIYVYRSDLILNSIYLPFTFSTIDLGWLIIPFVIIVFLATTNSVNLTDGLDGLAGWTSIIVFLAISTLNLIYTSHFSPSLSAEYVLQMQNTNTISFALVGSLLAFLAFNSYPAMIFMGDTGSLALGGLLATICVLNGLSLYIIIVGAIFVFSSVSVILQVISYKTTKKRIFLMAPFHHHLQKKGVHENKIVVIYILTTLILSVFCVLMLVGR